MSCNLKSATGACKCHFLCLRWQFSVKAQNFSVEMQGVAHPLPWQKIANEFNYLSISFTYNRCTRTQPLNHDHSYNVGYFLGTKCLSGTERLAGIAPGSRQGVLLNDSHAEVLARRGLLHWIMAEMREERPHST